MILQSAYAEKDGTQGGGETMFDIQYLPGNLFVIISILLLANTGRDRGHDRAAQ